MLHIEIFEEERLPGFTDEQLDEQLDKFLDIVKSKRADKAVKCEMSIWENARIEPLER